MAGMPQLRAAMHLDTVFTFADRDVVTLYPTVMDGVHTFVLHPSDAEPGVEVEDRGEGSVHPRWWARRWGSDGLRVIETGGDAYASERQQWDSGNNARRRRARRGLHLRPQHDDQRRCCAARASRWSRSSGPSSAGAAAAATA